MEPSVLAQNLWKELLYLKSRAHQYSPGRQQKIWTYCQNPKIHDLAILVERGEFLPKYAEARIGKGGKFRTICIPSVETYLIERFLLKEIELGWSSAIAAPVSYGRKKIKGESDRHTAACTAAILERRKSAPFAFQSDFINFYPSISHSHILDCIERFAPTNWPYKRILTACVNATVTESNRSIPLAVKQGSCLAPFLANLALSEWQTGWSPRTFLFRYVDDWIVLCDDRNLLSAEVTSQIDRLPTGIECHPVPEAGQSDGKARFTEPNEKITFLGLDLHANGTVSPSEKAIARFEEISSGILAGDCNFAAKVQKASDFLEGWKSYYSTCGVSQESLDNCTLYVKNLVISFLQKSARINRSQAGSIVKQLLPKPRAFKQSQLIDFARILSHIEQEEGDFLAYMEERYIGKQKRPSSRGGKRGG